MEKQYFWMTTRALSFKNIASPSISIPNILKLNLRPIICSTHVFSAMNSIEKVLDSTVACRLLYQIIWAKLANMMYLICDHLIFLSDAWYASTKAVTWTNIPLGLGASLVRSSFVPQYWSRNYFAVLPINNVGLIMERCGSKYNVSFGFFFKK